MGSSCPPEKLVVYKLELQTFWDEQTFPKQYPQVDEIILRENENLIFLLSGVQVLSGQRLWVSIDFHNIKTKQGLPYFIGGPSCIFSSEKYNTYDQVTPTANPFPSLRWASLSMRAFDSLLKLGNLRFVCCLVCSTEML